MTVQKLLDTPFATLTLDDETGIAHFRRTHERFPWSQDPSAPENAEFRRAAAEIDGALARLDPKQVALLVDLRDAPPPQSEQYERDFMRLRRDLQHFSVSAVLVRTAAGKLQVQRLAREEGNQVTVFLDEAAAHSHLLQALTKIRG